jgi:Mce-associated membrane protein
VTNVPEESTMQTPANRTLKVIKGMRTGSAVSARRRRVVLRPAPSPIEEVLERLDQEPVDERSDEARASGDPDEKTPELDGGSHDEPAAPARRRRALVWLLVALLAGTLALAGWYGHRWYQHQALEESRQGALAAAKQVGVNFVSVSAASVDRDLQLIVTGATGEFKEEFVRGQAQVRAAVVENKVESHGSVLRAGLVSADRRRAVALVALDATVKNIKVPDGRASHYRIQMDLVRDPESGQWLVSRLQFVG